jgi:hypothetical protein
VKHLTSRSTTRLRRRLPKRYRASINIALRIMMIGIFSLSGKIGAEVSQDEMRIQSEYEEGYALGVLEAEAEIENNGMTIYTFGLVIPPHAWRGASKATWFAHKAYWERC